MISDLEVKSIFGSLEIDNETYKYNIRGISIYDLLRFNIEIDLRNHKANIKSKFGYKKLRELISRYKSILLNKVTVQNKQLENVFINTNNDITSSFLFVSTSSWTRKPTESIELFDIIQYYHLKNEVINFVQPNYSNNISKQPYYNNYFSIDLHQIELTNTEKKIIAGFTKYISLKLNVDLVKNIKDYQNSIAKTFYLVDNLVKVIEVTKPKFVFSRSLYTEKWVVLACKLMNVKCIEVQHGVVSENNIYYQSFNKELLFPDYILTLGQEWTNILLNSTSKYNSNNLFTLGCKTKNNCIKKKENTSLEILFCLQHGIFQVNDLIINFLLKYGSLLIENNIFITLRPHPNAYHSTIKMFDKYINNNVRIQNSKEIILDEVIGNYNAIISSSSMCLYESLYYEIPTASFDKFKGITISKGLHYIADENGIWSFIKSVKLNEITIPKIDYLSNFDESVLDKFLTI